MTSIFNVQFVTKRGTDFQPSILKKDQNAKNMVMDIFLVLWSYLSTTELSCTANVSPVKSTGLPRVTGGTP